MAKSFEIGSKSCDTTVQSLVNREFCGDEVLQRSSVAVATTDFIGLTK